MTTLVTAIILTSLGFLLASLIAPFFLERSRKLRFPQTRPYTWGYFVGFTLMGAPFVIGLLHDPFGDELGAALALVYFPVGFFVMRRKRWATVVGTLMGLNPVYWVVNAIYFARRWSEFRAEAHEPKRGPIPTPEMISFQQSIPAQIAQAPDPAEQSPVLATQVTEKKTNLLSTALGVLCVVAITLIACVVTTEPGAGCKAQTPPPNIISSTPHESDQAEKSIAAPWRNTFFESENSSSQLPGSIPAPEQKRGLDSAGYPLEDRIISPGPGEPPLSKRTTFSHAKYLYDLKQYDDASGFFEAAAQQGHPGAEFYCGIMWTYGRGKAQENTVAMRYFREAAEQGVIEAQYNLGQGYWGGRGVEKNSLEAAKWFRKAADRGVVDAQYNLGVIYQSDAVLKDDQEAAKWFLKAAESGDVGAQSELGFLFLSGQGLPQNDERAAFWWERAAGQGDPAAQNGLGDLYSRGAGVSKDSTEALKWLNLAAAQNYGDALGKLAAFKTKVTAEEFREGKRRADEFVTTKASQPGQ
jgi:hypothetical protein